MIKQLVLKHQYVAFLCNTKNDFLEFVDIATDEMKFSVIFGPSGLVASIDEYGIHYRRDLGLVDNVSYSDKELILASAYPQANPTLRVFAKQSPGPFHCGIGEKSYILIVHGIYEHGQYYINNENEFTFHSINDYRLDVYTDKNTGQNWKILDSSIIFRKKKLEKLSK